MSDALDKYINEAIELELNVSDLYLLFYSLFPQDKNFWWALSIEEKNHAALLKNLKLLFRVSHELPPDILPKNLEDLEITNKEIIAYIDTFKNKPSRRKAFEYAIHLEESAGEVHFQVFAENKNLPEKFEIFQILNMDDKNHASRIQNYMNTNMI
jgi:hypothetical protein